MRNAVNAFLVKRDMDTVAVGGLWLVFLFAVASSIMHVAAMFGDGDHWEGILPALAIDGGLALATYALGRFRNNWVLGGFWVFLVLSVFANLDYTLQKLLGGAVTISAIWNLDPWQLFKVIAKASPPLVGAMMMEINTGVAELRRLQTPPTTTATTALATTGGNQQQPADNPQPKVKVRRRDNRLQAPKTVAALPGNLPTMPRLSRRQVGNSERKSSQQPPQQPATVANQQPIMGLPIPPTALDKLLAQAVIVYQGESSYDKAGRRLDVSGEMVRKRVLAAWEQDPEWVAQILPPERLPK